MHFYVAIKNILVIHVLMPCIEMEYKHRGGKNVISIYLDLVVCLQADMQFCCIICFAFATT